MIRKIIILFAICAVTSNVMAKDSLKIDTQDYRPVSIYNPFNYSTLFYSTPSELSFDSTFIKTANDEIELDPFDTNIDYTRLSIFGSVIIGGLAGIQIYQANAWWQTQDSKFRIVHDWEYALWIDKVGHFYATHLYAHVFSGGYEAANIQSEASTWYSASTALAYELFIEIQDGFGPEWGFSPGDAIFDFLGASFYVAQYYYPYLKNFQPKFSYIPTQEFLDSKDRIFIDDYEGQKYWVGMRMKNILPEKLAEYWPEILMLSVGMGVSDLDGSGGGQQSFYIALDLDVEQIPLYGPIWQYIKNTLNYAHFPMPGIRITPDAAFFGIVF
jgi:hypothetical protein